MCKIVKLLVLVVILVAGYSCTQSLDEIPESFETLKGLDIKWRKNVSESKKNVIRDILNDMVYVEGGLFLMGATNEQGIYARNNERPAHYVRLSSFYMGRREITIEQIEILLDRNFSSYEKMQGAPNFTWNDWAYVMKVIKECSNISVDFPTEAQWEYAARGGIYSKGYIYPGGNTLEEAEESENELGLVNLAKGHSEWCKDAYNVYSPIPLEYNPYYIQGLGHIVRGGNIKSVTEQNDYFNTFSTANKFSSCYDDCRNCRVSARSYCDETQSFLNTLISCRLVININEEE